MSDPLVKGCTGPETTMIGFRSIGLLRSYRRKRRNFDALRLLERRLGEQYGGRCRGKLSGPGMGCGISVMRITSASSCGSCGGLAAVKVNSSMLAESEGLGVGMATEYVELICSYVRRRGTRIRLNGCVRGCFSGAADTTSVVRGMAERSKALGTRRMCNVVSTMGTRLGTRHSVSRPSRMETMLFRSLMRKDPACKTVSVNAVNFYVTSRHATSKGS